MLTLLKFTNLKVLFFIFSIILNNAILKQILGRSKGEKSTDSPNSSFGETSKNHIQPLHTSFKRKQDQSFQGSQYPDTKRRKINPQDTEFVLIEHTNDTPTNMLGRLTNNSDTVKLDWKFDKSGPKFTCTVYLNGRNLGQAKGDTQKEAKKDAAVVALATMQKRYYTIKVTKNFTPTVTGNLGLDSTAEKSSESISNDNVGMKMMKMMGWSGGGLGKTSQGITEPVSVQQQMTREGLGLKPGVYNHKFFQKKCREVLQNYITTGDTSVDLVFTPSFSNEERAVIHNVAKQLGLKSQSYGPKTARTLMVSRKIHPRELVLELLELGGSTEKYQLIEPTGN